MYTYSLTGGTIGAPQKGTHYCGGRRIFCDGNCCRCENANIIYSNKNSTHTGPTIHIVKNPINIGVFHNKGVLL